MLSRAAYLLSLIGLRSKYSDCGGRHSSDRILSTLTKKTQHAAPQGLAGQSPARKYRLYGLPRLQETLQRYLPLLQLPPQRTGPYMHPVQGRVGYRTTQPPIASRFGPDQRLPSRHSWHPEPDPLTQHQPIPVSRSPDPRSGFPIPRGHSPDSSTHAPELARRPRWEAPGGNVIVSTDSV